MDVDTHFYWYLTRASGVVAFWLLTLSAALGASVTSRLWDGILERPWMFELHRFASLLALAFLGLHMAVLIPDPWTDFGAFELLLPGASTYRPLAVALGVLAMYGSIVATASFYVKKRLGHRTWRLLHFTTFLTFVFALLHGLYAGTDSGEPLMRLSYLAAMLLMFFLTVFRVLAGPASRQQGQRSRPPRQVEARATPGTQGTAAEAAASLRPSLDQERQRRREPVQAR